MTVPHWRRFAICGVAGLIALFSRCGDGGNVILLGATTSLQDSGILDALVARFEGESAYGIKPVVAGSGHVAELARQGEVDVIITHSPETEQQLAADGHVIERQPVMQNEFLLVGPPDDPASAGEADSIAGAFGRIAQAGSSFMSRGDGSGTNVRELAIWQQTGVDPAGQSWYQESAVGQGQSLAIASDRGAYTLVDSATFTVFRERVQLAPLATDNEVANVYSVMLVTPERHSGVNAPGARAFAQFLTSPETQAFIDGYGVDHYGKSLFHAAATEKP